MNNFKYTVFENKKGGRFYSGYSEDTCDGAYTIIAHTYTSSEAQTYCHQKREINKNLFIDSMPEELKASTKQILDMFM